MSDLNDLDLDTSAVDSHALEGMRHTGRTAIVAGLVVVSAALIYVGVRWTLPREPPAATTSEPAPAAATDVTMPSVGGEEITLPPLPETDPLVRELVRRLSSHPKVAAWLATQGLIANFTVVTANISEGRTPTAHLRALTPQAPFQTRGSGRALYLDPRSYRRYDDYADAMSALDAAGTARVYATLKPRILEAYRELGNPEGAFDPVLEAAIVELLEAPVVDGNVELEAITVSYTFADPKLESLSAAQKQLLRMGPRNVRLVQAKLREIAPLLGIPPASLPRPQQ